MKADVSEDSVNSALAVEKADSSAAMRIRTSKACDQRDLAVAGGISGFKKWRARYTGRPIDFAQQCAKASSGQMACQGLRVKDIGLQPQADDFNGQIIECGMALGVGRIPYQLSVFSEL